MGLKDIIAVVMPDAVLVAHKDRAQDVKTAVAKLKEKGICPSVGPRGARPWTESIPDVAVHESVQSGRVTSHAFQAAP